MRRDISNSNKSYNPKNTNLLEEVNKREDKLRLNSNIEARISKINNNNKKIKINISNEIKEKIPYGLLGLGVIGILSLNPQIYFSDKVFINPTENKYIVGFFPKAVTLCSENFGSKLKKRPEIKTLSIGFGMAGNEIIGDCKNIDFQSTNFTIGAGASYNYLRGNAEARKLTTNSINIGFGGISYNILGEESKVQKVNSNNYGLNIIGTSKIKKGKLVQILNHETTRVKGSIFPFDDSENYYGYTIKYNK